MSAMTLEVADTGKTRKRLLRGLHYFAVILLIFCC